MNTSDPRYIYIIDDNARQRYAPKLPTDEFYVEDTDRWDTVRSPREENPTPCGPFHRGKTYRRLRPECADTSYDYYTGLQLKQGARPPWEETHYCEIWVGDCFGWRAITVSTVGIIPGIEALLYRFPKQCADTSGALDACRIMEKALREEIARLYTLVAEKDRQIALHESDKKYVVERMRTEIAELRQSSRRALLLKNLVIERLKEALSCLADRVTRHATAGNI